jgi:hypothetical protein
MKVVNRILGEAMTSRQRQIYKELEKPETEDENGEVNPSGVEKAFDWAVGHGRRFLEAESTIARKDPYLTYKYAKYVIKGRWPEGEANILRNLEYAIWYTSDVIKGRWPEVEEAIINDPNRRYWILSYAKNVIQGRWPEAEEAIAKTSARDEYLRDWPDAKEDWILNGWLDWLDT